MIYFLLSSKGLFFPVDYISFLLCIWISFRSQSMTYVFYLIILFIYFLFKIQYLLMISCYIGHTMKRSGELLTCMRRVLWEHFLGACYAWWSFVINKSRPVICSLLYYVCCKEAFLGMEIAATEDPFKEDDPWEILS